jgi:protein-S-isoprenylcysteine O-methyltransferase Ste14
LKEIMIHRLPLSLLLLATILSFYAMDFYFMLRYDRQRRKGKGWAWDYTLLTAAAGLLIILQPAILPQVGWSTKNGFGLAVQVTGLIFIVVSFAMHIWARLHLQKFYAERVEVQADHQVIQTGPYALVRHPVITSFFALTVGLFLVNPALTTVLVVAYTFWDFSRAARQEETLLAQTLPGYADYMKRTPRFLPRLKKRSHRADGS